MANYKADKSGKRPSDWKGEWTVKHQGQLRMGQLPMASAPTAQPTPTPTPTTPPPTQTPTPPPTAPAGQPQAGQKRYYYKEGNKIDVWDRQTDTHITAEQAKSIPDFWSQVEAYNYPSGTPAPTAPPADQKPYYYKPGDNINVWDRTADKIVSAEQAKNIPDFWSQVEKPYHYKEGDKTKVWDRRTDTHITAEEAAKIPNFWSQVEETDQMTNEANEFQENLFNNLPDGDDLGISDSQKLLSEIIDRLETDPPEKPKSMAELFAETKESLGMEELETELADIDNQIDEINSELLIQAEEAGYGQQLVTTAQLGRRKGKLQREAENRIQRLNIQRGAVARMLNNKISSLNMTMSFLQTDYQNAAAYYKSEFDRSIKMYGLLAKQEDREMEIEERAEQDARANWEVIYNAVNEGQMDYDSLSDDNKLQIRQLEIQANLPVGMMDNLKFDNPDQDIVTTTTRTDASGGQWFDVLMQDKNGEISVKSVYKGAGKVTGGSGGTSGGGKGSITTPEGGESDITTMEGIAQAIKGGQNPADIRKQLDTETKFTVNTINALMEQGTSYYIAGELEESKGKDGFVDTGLYLELKQKHPKAFKPFTTPEAIKELLNPDDPTAQTIKGMEPEEEDNDDKTLKEFLEGGEKEKDKQGFWGSIGIISNWLRGK